MNHNIGLLGGTFNPVHTGHVEIGLNILHDFKLDEIYYILSAYPPHKSEKKVIKAELRWEMLVKALDQYERLVPCDVEMKRISPSWTIDTVNSFLQKYPDCNFYFICGSEGFLNITTWKNYKKLLELLPFIVLIRQEEHVEKIISLADKEKIRVCFNQKKEYDLPVIFIYRYKSKNLNISSTLVRNNSKTKKSVNGLVAKEVEQIMKEYNLYES